MDASGNFSFLPDPGDDGNIYQFLAITHDDWSFADTCQFAFKVGAWVCGDANGDGAVDISDAVHLIGYIFAGGLPPNPTLVGDVNCDSATDISDVVYLIGYIFGGGPSPCSGC